MKTREPDRLARGSMFAITDRKRSGSNCDLETNGSLDLKKN